MGTEEEVLDAIGEILTRDMEFQRPVRSEDDLLRDLMLDSLGLTVLAVGLEDRFRVRLSHELAPETRTAGDLARWVAAHLEEQRP
jgi:acyl carrier protein